MNILDLLFPKRCVGCGKVGKYFCVRCRAKIRTIDQGETICPVCEKPAIDGITHPHCKTRYSLDGLTSFFHYNGIIQKAVKSIKYRFVSDLAKEFIYLIPCHSREGGNPSALFSSQPWIPGLTRDDRAILVPIPLHSSRLRARGFNQAEVLGKFLAQRLNVPFRTDLVKRVVQTLSQVEVKDREKRLKNMEKAFQVTSDVKDVAILLFDDVWTTGATLRSAGNILKREGASFVWGLTMAR